MAAIGHYEFPGVGALPLDPLRGHPRYKTVELLGMTERDIRPLGAAGPTVLAEDLQTGERVVITFVEAKRNQGICRRSFRAVWNHLVLAHPHVVQLREVLCCPPYIGVVEEYVPGTFREYVVSRGGLSEQEARCFFQQVILVIDYCRKKGILPQIDIDMEHMRLVENPAKKPLLKLAHFGFSRSALTCFFNDVPMFISLDSQGKPAQALRVIDYCAPEIMKNVKHYCPWLAVVWSAGVLLYAMLFLCSPFDCPELRELNRSQQHQEALAGVVKCEYKFPASKEVSEECRDLISRLIVADPTKRLSLAQIQEHPWLKQDLPPGASEFNASIMQYAGRCTQSQQELRAIVALGTPLHLAAASGKASDVAALLEARLALAAAEDIDGWRAVHRAAAAGKGETLSLLLAAVPPEEKDSQDFWLHLFDCAVGGEAGALQVVRPLLPSDAWDAWQRTCAAQALCNAATARDVARLKALLELLGSRPPGPLLPALAKQGMAAWSVYPTLVVHWALAPEEWQHVPVPCPGLAAALSAVLQWSGAAGAREVAAHLLPTDKRRLRAAALCLARAQRSLGVALPGAVVGRLLALGLAA